MNNMNIVAHANAIPLELMRPGENSSAKILEIVLATLQVIAFIIFIICVFKFKNYSDKKNNTLTSSIDENQKIDELKKIHNKKVTIIVIAILCIIFTLFIQYFKTIIFAVLKPIIYLYPETEQEISVELGYPNKVTTSYPKYTTGWNVLAEHNGDLTDLDTGKNLYSLYYESDAVVKFKVEKDGFCVKGEDVADFLEEKLDTLGLNYKEKEEFIVYWLPKLEANKYNYIRFATQEEINQNMPLQITPAPDTLIRVLMTFKGLNHPINVEEQQLVAPERNGFVAVEWGGTEIK